MKCEKNHRAARNGRLRGMMLPIIGILLYGCSINPHIELNTLASETQPLRLVGVPFYPQTQFQCGPAALAGVLGASGIYTTADELSLQVYLPGRHGSLQVELMAATRRAGRLPYVIDADPGALVAELEAGRPVLVFQNLRTRSLPAWHYSVLVGADPQSNVVYLNTGVDREAKVPAPEFLRTWDWANRWAMVAVKPGTLPANANALRYIDAAVDFEQIAAPIDAELVWAAARREWPGQPLPHLALGNLAYASGDLIAAARHYGEGRQSNPDDPALSNNLASVLGQLGCAHHAIQVLDPIREKLSPNSPWYGIVQETMQELAHQGAEDVDRCARLMR